MYKEYHNLKKDPWHIIQGQQLGFQLDNGVTSPWSSQLGKTKRSGKIGMATILAPKKASLDAKNTQNVSTKLETPNDFPLSQHVPNLVHNTRFQHGWGLCWRTHPYLKLQIPSLIHCW